MGLNPDVCLAVSKGLSVLCALITHSCLSPAASVFGGFVQRDYRGIKRRISPGEKDPITPQSELQVQIIRVYDMIILITFSLLFPEYQLY